MKKLILVLLCFSFLLFADWTDTLNDIDSNIENIAGNASRSESSLVSVWTALYAQSQGLGLSIRENTEFHTPIYESETLPSGLQAIANKYNIINDNTRGYNEYVLSRQFGNSNKQYLDTNTSRGDGFFDTEYSMKSIDTVHNHFKNGTTDITQTMATQTPTVNKTNDIVLHSTALINGYLNTTYDDYTFFTLDLSGLGQMLQSWNPGGVMTSNPFENWKFKCNFVPDEQNNPYMYKLYQCMNTFYTQYYGKFIIQICFSMWLVMMLWQKLIGVFNVE